MGIRNLPNELLLLIAENLSVKDLFHLLSTDHHLSSLLTPRFHALALEDVGALTALQWAAARGHASLAELVISQGVELNQCDKGQFDKTPLHTAVVNENPNVIRVLVKHGAQINSTSRFLQTPLHYAVSGSLAVVRVLIELGADMTCKDIWGKTPVHGAARRPVHYMKPFVNAGFDFTYEGASGRTILHAAVLEPGVGMVEYLLCNGGREIINSQDFHGMTPLHLALLQSSVVQNEVIIGLLLENGADTEVKDDQGHTPMWFNTIYAKGEFTELLLRYKGNRLDCE